MADKSPYLSIQLQNCQSVLINLLTYLLTYLPFKRGVQDHVTHFKFSGPSHIFEMAKARVVKFCTQANYIIA